MNQLTYTVGDATSPPEGGGRQLIVHCCNDQGAWGAGFVKALSRRYPHPEAEYRAWANLGRDGDVPFALGHVQFVPADPDDSRDLWVANLIGQHGIGRAADGSPPVRYDAIAGGLATIADWCLAHQASVHCPRFGAGLAGGSWSRVALLLAEHVVDAGINVTVHDPP